MNAFAAVHRRLPAAATAALLAVAAPALLAQGAGHPPSSSLEVKQEAASMQDKIGVQLDPGLEFADERGYPFKLQQLFPGQHPVVLVPGYYGCPDMCGEVVKGMVAALNEVDLRPGTDYLIVNVSIDPRETAEVAQQRKAKFLHQLHHVGGEDGWRFLVGQEPAIKALTQSVGFRYFWAEHDNRFAHPGALLFVTPQGKLSRVLTGTTFDATDVRLAIVEASEGKLGTFWDDFRLNCLTFDPRTGSYALLGMTVMRVGGAVTLVAIAVMIVVLVRREKRRAVVPVSP